MTDKPLREFASTQVDLPELWPTIKAWISANLKPEQLDPENGIETAPHVTILFGLHGEQPSALRALAQKFGKPITLTLDALNFFENETHDVLYISISSRDLAKLRKVLSGLPHTDTHKTYTPHLTIAYLKKGEAAKFKGNKPFRAVFTRTGFTLSKKDGTKEFISTSSRSFLLGEIPQRKPISDSVDKPNQNEYN